MPDYLDTDHWKVAQLVDELNAAASEKRALQLIELLKPEFSKDGNQFCFIYGKLPNDCVVGFGNTAGEAMYDFSKNFWNYKATNPQHHE